jgi:pimeloyl-ACP methyl ester carboxylesterase
MAAMDSAASSSRRVDVGEVVLDVVVEGDPEAPPIVLLHGFPETSAEWRLVTPHLVEAGFRVVAPDQRGYSAGARPAGSAAYAIDRLVADVVGLLDGLGLASAHLVGHDWGAMVAWCVAARHPERTRTLTAVSVPHPRAFAAARRSDADQQQRSAYIGFLAQRGKAERLLLEDGGRRLRAMYAGAVPDDLADHHLSVLTEPEALTAALEWYRATPLSGYEEVPAVTVPTTYVWGTGDAALGRAGAEGCGAHVDAAYRFVELEGASHWIPEECPERLAAEVLATVGRPTRR